MNTILPPVKENHIQQQKPMLPATCEEKPHPELRSEF